MLKMSDHQDTEELNVTEEEFDRELEQRVLNRMRKYLCDHLEPERFFPYLQTKEYLDPESCEQIRSAGTTKSRTNKMLDILIRSGRNPLIVLIKAIEKNGPTQKFVTEKMKEEHLRICADPSNIGRRSSIRSRNHLEPTNPYVPWVRGRPPPYSILPSSCCDRDSFGAGSTFRCPSAFPYHPSNVHVKESEHSKTHKCQPTNDFTPGEPSARRPLNNGGFPRTPSEAPESIFPRDPSHFQTNDFLTGPHTSALKETSSVHQTNDLLPEPRVEILSHQHTEEQKILLRHSTLTSPFSLAERIATKQEKELSKYDSGKTNPVIPIQWIRTPRTPSEHDASVTYTRSSPINAPSPSNDSANRVKIPSPSNVSKPFDGSIMQTEENVRRSFPSCQSSSIQPSCFTSSSFENLESCQPPKIFSEVQKTAVKSMGDEPPCNELLMQNPVMSKLSKSLELIPSVEVPSLENSDGQPSVNIRRPPTEHEDASIITRSLSDDGGSSLEISTDSEASEQ